ncbi:MAG: hypothetical protein Q8P93_00345 [bacterium]|nr:hypothetical protein [bacterium]
MEELLSLNNRVLLATRILRLGIAFSFLFAGYASFTDPVSWVGFLPPWIDMYSDTILFMSAVGEVIVGMWLLSGWQLPLASSIAAASLFGIVLFNVGQFQILFRDFALGIGAVALAVLGTLRVEPDEEKVEN